jgi:hypothetical protein
MFRRIEVAQCWLLLALVASPACGSGEADGPADTLSRFLETLDRSSLNDGARREAFAMLDETAQAGLADRAQRASRVTGRPFAPWEMIAPGRFRLRFAPAEHAGMRSTVTGDHAVVHVRAMDGKERASVPMTRQGGRWRVQLAVVSNGRREPLPPAKP